MRLVDSILAEMDQEAQTTRKVLDQGPGKQTKLEASSQIMLDVRIPLIYGPSADEDPFV